jgi:hypothetical protein
MSHRILGGFGTLRKLIARRWLVMVSVVGGLALGLSALVGMLQSALPPHRPAEIQRHVLHDRVQRVREALHMADGVPGDHVASSRLAQWYNWGNSWSKTYGPWDKYRD